MNLRLHVFSPSDQTASAHRAAIVLFFGGGRTSGSIAQFVPQARHLAGRGMVAVVADYRVRARHGSSPYQSIADAKSAMRWTRSHGGHAWHRHPDRIAAGGGSSGGHLALATAMIEGFDEAAEDLAVRSTPNALVLFNPPL